MDFNTYQSKAHSTAKYPYDVLYNGEARRWIYPALGLGAESGELINKLKKILRDGATVSKEELESELGDILWYVSELCTVFNLALDEVAQKNLDKLEKRYST